MVQAEDLDDQVREAVDDLGHPVEPGAALTIPNTRPQAAIRSRSPSARRRLPRMDSPVSRAAA